ncbi:hypothetical protein [Guillardia theta]|uniref:Uncharacterized protein n=1 Tax=Guillardia theta TaxID=55529 RepID=Q9AW31_GUITH|nr:hypothetical protein GTHECHR2157 [Guillardia theta]CAC27040.1 hypothetical protein [Guillardia theta]
MELIRSNEIIKVYIKNSNEIYKFNVEYFLIFGTDLNQKQNFIEKNDYFNQKNTKNKQVFSCSILIANLKKNSNCLNPRYK